jgi:ornithine cyclodeaminase/alanine dehydrogenase-like protein (mu-crystallin family)
MIQRPEEEPMSETLVLTNSDFQPLRNDLAAMDGAIKAVEVALVAQQRGAIRQGRLVDRRPGEFEGIRVSLLAGDGLYSGMRVFGNPPHTRAFMLFDGETRALLALMDYGVLNSLRVGATAGVAARFLTPGDARTVGLIGSGWQAQPQLAALRRALPGLEVIRVFSPTRAHREAFAAKMAPWLGLTVEPVEGVQAALDGADVVDLCAPGHFDVREPLFEPSWVKAGAFVISMAPSQYTADFVRSSRVVAASWENLTVEPPAPRPPYTELMERNEFPPDKVTALGSVILDGANPRRSPDDTVIYHLEGGTAQDLFIATWGYEWAISRGLGKPFDLSA